jgi:hypothetical protein
VSFVNAGCSTLNKPDNNLIIRYLKVKALADRGSPGERENASRILARLQKAHPGIQAAARAYEQEEKRNQEEQAAEAPAGAKEEPKGPPNPREAGGYWSEANMGPSGPSGPFGAFGNWEDIYQYAQAAVNGVYNFAQTAANVALGRQVADEVQVSTRVGRTGNLLLTFRFAISTWEAVTELNALQARAFREAMHELLDAELDRLFGDD